MSIKVLKIENLVKTFYPGTINEKKALNRLNLSLESGEFVTILGSNGAGKSTLFNAICGGFPLDSGEIYLNEKNISRLPDYKRAIHIGRLFQDPMKGTSPNLTIEENLSLAYGRGDHNKGIFALNKRNTSYFREALSSLELGLEDRMKTKVGTLSGGQRQAVSLIMSTISNPKLLLLDEHTAALDPKTAVKILSITKDLIATNNITTLMITHDISAALSLGTRTIMLDEGTIIFDFKGEERTQLTPTKLLDYYSSKKKKELANDRMLFSID